MQKYEETFKKSKEMIYYYFCLKIKIIGLFNFIFLIIKKTL